MLAGCLATAASVSAASAVATTSAVATVSFAITKVVATVSPTLLSLSSSKCTTARH